MSGGYYMYAPQYPYQWQPQSTAAGHWCSAALVPSPPMPYVDPVSATQSMPLVSIAPNAAAVSDSQPNVPQWISPVDGTSGKPRRPRATQACEQCRTRKQRCDEGEPCTFCKSNDLDCTYRPLLSPKADKVVEYLLSWAAMHAEGLRMLTQKIESLEECIRSREGDKQGTSTALRQTTPELECDSALVSSVLMWPEVRKLFAASNIQCDESYMARAEERHASLHTSIADDDGQPAISACTINRLHEAFLAGIWTLHPILDRSRLSSIMEILSRAYASHTQAHIPPRINDCETEPAAKRRRVKSPAACNSSSRCLEQSPNNAVALLVLALGETIVDDHAAHAERGTIPGWAFYSAASRIMSGHIDGSSLTHAQMFLLAGMYKARLGRLGESASWYSMAGRILLHLVRRHDICQQQFLKSSFDLSTREGRILMASWCGLRLEKSIAPELHLPESGLQDLQSILPLPGVVPHVTETTSMHAIRTARALCELHSLRSEVDDYLHHTAASVDDASDINQTMKQHALSLQDWRAKLSFACWDDADAPPTSSEHAHLRYEYWRTKLAIVYPFLDYVLHILPGMRLGMDLQSCSLNANGQVRPISERRIINAIHLMASDEVLHLAELAVCVLNHKLAAFHGINASAYSGMTMIAHEQFQDLLVLHSAHRSQHLHTLVPKVVLSSAFQHTIDLLHTMADVSPTCREDHNILIRVRCALIDTSLTAGNI